MDKVFFSKGECMKKFFFFILVSLMSLNIYSQDFNLRGKVSDMNGEPLIGVNVVEDGTLNGTVTDIDGMFNLTVSNRNATLKLTYIGYETTEIPVTGRTNLEITMAESSSQLDEVVVVGYGTQRKVTLTGSVDAISGSEIQNRSGVLVSDLIK